MHSTNQLDQGSVDISVRHISNYLILVIWSQILLDLTCGVPPDAKIGSGISSGSGVHQVITI